LRMPFLAIAWLTKNIKFKLAKLVNPVQPAAVFTVSPGF